MKGSYPSVCRRDGMSIKGNWKKQIIDKKVKDNDKPKNRMRISILVVVSILLASSFVTLFGIGTVGANSGICDSCGYSWTDNLDPSPKINYDWLSASGGGHVTRYGRDPATFGPYPIGFNFNYYNITYSDFYIYDVGWLFFGDDGNRITALTCPYGDGGMWIPDSQAVDIWFRNTGSMPNRQLIVTFDYRHYRDEYWPSGFPNQPYDDTDTEYIFQIILYESGSIRVQYSSIIRSYWTWYEPPEGGGGYLPVTENVVIGGSIPKIINDEEIVCNCIYPGSVYGGLAVVFSPGEFPPIPEFTSIIIAMTGVFTIFLILRKINLSKQ